MAQVDPQPGGGNPPHPPAEPPTLAPGLTPPCTVSDLCVDVDNYMPVWRWDPAGRQMNECPSPLFIRKDAYTCNKIRRILGNSESPIDVGIDPNAFYTNSCPKCNIGYVGINATIPEEQLHVIGNVRCQEGAFQGAIEAKAIHGEILTDPDGMPNNGDETYADIPVLNPMILQTFTAYSGNINFLNANHSTLANSAIANLVATNTTTTNLTVYNNTTTNNLTVNNTPTFHKGITIKNSDLKITDASNNVIWNFRPDGKLGVGVASADMKGPYWMWVKNGIMTERVKVAVKGTNDWADDVFDKNYSLKSLEELEMYTKKKKHLPNIPSADEVVKNGYDVQTMDAKLLRKVEELTLYVIELQKEIKSIKKKK